jgi:hypothetical protein
MQMRPWQRRRRRQPTRTQVAMYKGKVEDKCKGKGNDKGNGKDKAKD